MRPPRAGLTRRWRQARPRRRAIPPEVVAAPTRANLVNVAPSSPGVVAFFAPAVLALILQHLAVTLVAMSLVRERMSGVMEVFRIAPVSAAEILAGKLLAFGLIGGGRRPRSRSRCWSSG